MRIWNDRIVLPDGTVIMPEEVTYLLIHTELVVVRQPDLSQLAYNLDKARIDRCTFQPDKNGTMIYENDRVKDEYGFEWVVTWRDGGFILCSDILSDEAVLLYEDYEVTGMEPYKEVEP